MSLRELPAGSQRVWLLGGEGERSPAATASAVRWSSRRVVRWGGACVGIVAGFIVSVFLFLMITVPEPASYLG
jgi:hypothetical protein